MNEDNKKRLTANFKLIEENLNVDDVSGSLYQFGILTDEDMEYINYHARGVTPQEGARRLIFTLFKRGSRAFSAFIESLKNCEAEYEFISDAISNTDPSTVETPELPHDHVDNAEKISILQSQLWQQTKIFMDLQKEIVNLRERATQSEEEASKLKEKNEQLETCMKDFGVTQGETSSILFDFMDSRCNVIPMNNEIPEGYDESDFHQARKKQAVNLTEDIAKYLGIDIVDFMSKINTSHPLQTNNIYAKTLRRTVTEMTQRHTELFEKFMQTLEINELNGYETLMRIADEVIRGDSMNWGRIVALYAFGGWVGRNAVKNNQTELAKIVGEFLGFYIYQRLGNWIEDNGGWDGFVSNFPEASTDEQKKWTSYLLTGIGLGALAALAVVKNN